MRRTRFTRPSPVESDADRVRIPTGRGIPPVTPRRPANAPEQPESMMMFNYGPSARRRPTMDERDSRFIDPADRGMFTPAARASRMPVSMPAQEELLQVTGVNLHIVDNSRSHHTDRYEETETRRNEADEEKTGELVMRRAQKFDITLTFGRPFRVDRDNLHLVFQIGTMPRTQWQTMVTVPVTKASGPPTEGTPDHDPNGWTATIQKQEGNSLSVSVYIAADCIIGEWDFSVYSVQHKPQERPKIYVYDHPDNIFILLNPWSPYDSVYMSESELLNEYVLNDTGGIFIGSHKDVRPRPWFFGQFEDGILEITLHLLRRAFGYSISTKMSDPIQISRALSKMVNSNDDQGVVVGRWDGEYEDGKGPSSWTGSVSILDQYDKTAGAVKYGQCWVFSGVLTTVCRAIGLPTRCVSNFLSAHDTNGNTTVDRHLKFDEKGDVVFLNEQDKDSIWNFHVWNDAWMKRPDLPAGFDGWQTIDSTPQELSEGSYQCGPSPISASKSGNIHLPFDTPFVFSEVNGHIVYWEMKSEQEWKQIHVDKFGIGKFISTKIPNGKPLKSLAWGVDHPDREDITFDYKHPDGSKEEETAMTEVNKQLELGLTYVQPKKELSVWLKDIVSVNAGDEVEIVAAVYNNSEETRTVSVGLSATITTYNGVGIKDIATRNFPAEKIEAGKKRIVNLTLTAKDYIGHLVSNGSVLVKVQGRSLETDESFVRQDTFILKPPELDVDIRTEGELETRKPFHLVITFRNPLKTPLTGCSLELSGPGLLGRTFTVKPRQTTVPPGENFRETIRLVSRRAGVRELVVTLDTDQLPDIFGFKTILVYYP